MGRGSLLRGKMCRPPCAEGRGLNESDCGLNGGGAPVYFFIAYLGKRLYINRFIIFFTLLNIGGMKMSLQGDKLSMDPKYA